MILLFIWLISLILRICLDAGTGGARSLPDAPAGVTTLYKYLRDNERMREKLNAYLARHPVRQLLWLGSENDPPPSLPNTQTQFIHLHKGVLAELGDQHYDCAVLEGLPGPLDKAEALALVAHLRDIQSQCLLWVIESRSQWCRQDLLALGFHQLDQAKDGSQLFGFDIDNYKTTPDWLNPKHWANPERWNKKRW